MIFLTYVAQTIEGQLSNIKPNSSSKELSYLGKDIKILILTFHLSKYKISKFPSLNKFVSKNNK